MRLAALRKFGRVGSFLLLTACAKERPPVDAPLPAPKRLVEPRFGPALAETKRLVDTLLATPRAAADAPAEQLRAWALEGWMPAQAKRRALFDQLEMSLPKSDFAGAALLEGKAMESLAQDWANLRVAECEGDPMVWLDRARERYETCAALAGNDDADMQDFCSARADALRKGK